MPTTGRADDAAIREQAYLLWEQEGRPEGRETEFWMRAEVALTSEEQAHTLIEDPKPKKARSAASKSAFPPAKAEAGKRPKKK